MTAYTPSTGIRHRTRPRDTTTPLHALKPSGPGVGWRLSRTLLVRFSTDMRRIHDTATRANVVTLKPQQVAGGRPCDRVLGTLVAFLARPDAANGTRRCWKMRQLDTGWTLALEIRGGPSGSVLLLPAVDDDGLPVTFGPEDTANIARHAEALWAAANTLHDDPDNVPRFWLQALAQKGR